MLVLTLLALSISGALQDIQVKTLEFPSGLKAVLAKTPPTDEPRVFVTTYVAYGTMQEPKLGYAHFIEHIVANSPSKVKGLPKAPEGAKSYLGNATTKQNYTNFIRCVAPDGVEAAIYSRLSRLTVERDPNVVEGQRKRVNQELERVRDYVPYSAYKALEATAKGWPADLDSESNSVNLASAEELWDMIERVYHPARSVLVIAGEIDFDHTERLVKAAVERLGLGSERGRPQALPYRKFAPFSDGTRVKQNPPDNSWVGVAFDQPAPNSSDFPAFLVVDQLLLGGRSNGDPSRSADGLFSKLVETEFLGTEMWDAKEKEWGSPPLADGSPALYAIVFRVPDAQQNSRFSDLGRVMSRMEDQFTRDRVRSAANHLADFYEEWLMEPDHRVLGDHLAGLVLNGKEPEEVKALPSRIRAVTADAAKQSLRKISKSFRALVVTTPR